MNEEEAYAGISSAQEVDQVRSLNGWGANHALQGEVELNNYACNLTQQLQMAFMNQNGKTSSLQPEISIKNLDQILKSNMSGPIQQTSKRNYLEKPNFEVIDESIKNKPVTRKIKSQLRIL